MDKPLLLQIAKILRHRGPDDVGYFYDKEVALGNTRLSIIDIKGGHQPIHNEDSTIWITYNGEIYNFQELRQELEQHGHGFYTRSDTEVIVHAYEEWGENCTKKFNGMWAFALWDSNQQHLLLSRDRVGIKPLYYFSNGKEFVFASEIKAILLEKSIPRIPNDRMIFDYLVYGLHDHTEQTFFTNIKRLLPAHNLLIDKKGMREIRYWEIEQANDAIEDSDERDEEYAKKFLELFQDSVKRELIGEVPVGTCLSGGLDSASIVYVINRLILPNSDLVNVVGARQKTFSAVFEDKRIDERRYIDEVAKDTKAEKNEILPSSKQLWEDIQKIVYYQDEPFMSTSIYAQWCAMKLASQKVKVVLDGQGGDEILAGYIPYYLIFSRILWRKKKIYRFLKELLLSIDMQWPYIKSYILSPFRKRLNETKKLLNPKFVAQFADINFDEPPRSWELSDFMRHDIAKASLPALLRYEDRNSMAWSLEARVPFLDHRLIEYAFSLPVTQKLKNGWTKYVFRNSMKGILPDKIRKRRDKIAFETPQVAWLKELRREVKQVFASKEFGERKYFDQEKVLKTFDELCEGKSGDDHSVMLWRVINLELWLRSFFDGSGLNSGK